MPVESTADLAAMFDPDEFAEPITWVSATQTKVLHAIYDAEHLSLATDASVAISTAEPQITCRASDVPDDAAQGDTVSVRGQDHVVRDIRPDGTGVIVAILERV